MENKLLAMALSVMATAVLLTEPLPATAEDATEPATISPDAQEFWQDFQQEYQRIQDANQEALDEGLISIGSNDYVTTFGVYGSMRLYADYMNKMYGATDPYTYSSIPAGGSCTGLYKVSGDDSYHVVTVSTAGAAETTIVIADDYTVTATCNPKTGNYTFGSLTTDNYFGYKTESASSFYITLKSEYQETARWGDYNYSTGKYSCWTRFGMNSSSVPTINPSTVLTYVNETVGGYPAYSVIPDGQIDPERPWEYYNETLVPEIQQNFPDVTVDMLPLGFEWTPATVDPVEPIETRPPIPLETTPFLPWVSPVTEIVENTNESGEIVTEVVMVTNESGAEEYEYNFQAPSLPALKVPDIDVPLDIDIDGGLLAGVSAIWDEIYRLLVASGLMRVLVPALTIGLLLYICTKLG